MGADAVTSGEMLRWSMVLSCLLWLCAPGLLHAEILTKAEQVRRLTLKETAARMPVKLTGVITYVRGQGAGLVLQDDTGGVMLEWPKISEFEVPDPVFKVGMKAEVEGYTSTSPPTPRIAVSSFRDLGTAPLPEPVEMDLAALRSSDLDGSFVTCRNVIRTVRIEQDVTPPRLVIEMGPASGRLSVWLSRWDPDSLGTLVPGATIQVKGVFMRWKTVNWLPLVPFLVVNQPDWVTVVGPPPESAQVPLRNITEVLHAAMDDVFSEAFRVTGTVTYADPSTVVLQQKNDILWIRPAESASLSPGDRVEAVGFPALNGPRGELEDASVRKTGSDPLPPALALQPYQLQRQPFMSRDGERVSIRGRVSRGSPGPDGAPLQMLFGNMRVPLYFASAPSEEALPPEGSLVQVTGVLEAGLNARLLKVGRGDADYRLHVQGMADLRVIQSGPWWTPARIFTVVGSTALLALAAGGWALFLRRRVGEKSKALVQEIAARREQEIVLQERKRLAADLHDTLEQTLTGASLQLDALDSVDAPKPLLLARRLLDRSRDELRRAVWDLTPEVIEESGFAQALDAIAREQSELGMKIDVAVTGETAGVPDRIAAHLCRVVQECISNAARHGQARSVEVDLQVDETAVAMRVNDDGRGFDPETAPGISTGHFGINGMKERLRRLGGRVEIHSRPGGGTQVVVSCPLSEAEDREEMA